MYVDSSPNTLLAGTVNRRQTVRNRPVAYPSENKSLQAHPIDCLARKGTVMRVCVCNQTLINCLSAAECWCVEHWGALWYARVWEKDANSLQSMCLQSKLRTVFSEQGNGMARNGKPQNTVLSNPVADPLLRLVKLHLAPYPSGYARSRFSWGLTEALLFRRWVPWKMQGAILSVTFNSLHNVCILQTVLRQYHEVDMHHKYSDRHIPWSHHGKVHETSSYVHDAAW